MRIKFKFLHFSIKRKIWLFGGSGCSTVGRLVASDTRGPQFEYNHGQKFIMYLFTDDYCKEAGIDPFFKCKMGLLLSTVNV